VATANKKALPSDYLCDAMECRYPRVDVTVAEKVRETILHTRAGGGGSLREAPLYCKRVCLYFRYRA
jgi:hypothetical protein